jgi:cytochrome c biogenesis protein CcmG/thiol:disulfide interchange protein DsbE
MIRPLKFSLQVAALATVFGLLGLLVWRVTHQQHPPKIGGAAPGFSAEQIAGSQKLSLASLRGKAVVINFFQSYCEPCQAESKALEAAWRHYRGQGVVFLGVDYNDLVSDARRFIHKHGVTYPVVRDPNGSVAAAYGITGTPETFFVDRHGRLVGAHIEGPIDAKQNRSLFAASIGVAAKQSS